MVRLDDRHIEELYTRLRETESRVRRVEESLAGTLARLAAVGAGVEALTASCGVRSPALSGSFCWRCFWRCCLCGVFAAAASAFICALVPSASCLCMTTASFRCLSPRPLGLSQKWEEPVPEDEQEEEQEGKVFTPQQEPQSYGQFPSVVRAAEPLQTANCASPKR